MKYKINDELIKYKKINLDEFITLNSIATYQTSTTSYAYQLGNHIKAVLSVKNTKNTKFNNDIIGTINSKYGINNFFVFPCFSGSNTYLNSINNLSYTYLDSANKLIVITPENCSYCTIFLDYIIGQ